MKDDKTNEQMTSNTTYSASLDKLESRLEKEVLKTEKPWASLGFVSILLLLLTLTLIVSFCFAINLFDELTTLILVVVIAILGLGLFSFSERQHK